MKTSVALMILLLIGALAVCPALAIVDGNADPAFEAASDGYANKFGPDPVDPGAPNAGDGDPDGSGWDPVDHGAPNSGDGIPDGSGWGDDHPGAQNLCPLYLLVFSVGVF